MTFVSELEDQMNEWDDADDLHRIEEFWTDLARNKTATVGNYTMNVLRVTGGPNEAYGDDYQFVFTVDDQTYLANVDYNSYEYSGNQYSIYTAEAYEVTETRYKPLARAR